MRTARVVVVVTVADNGPGLPEGDPAQVFDPFYTTKAPGKGTGLGLAICARLVEGMGGRIGASNGPDGGAVFELRLPGIVSEAVEEDGRAERPEGLNKGDDRRLPARSGEERRPVLTLGAEDS